MPASGWVDEPEENERRRVELLGDPKEMHEHAVALQAVARHEEGPRGLYGGAVFRGSTAGDLDAALVLRTLIGAGEEAWLRAGAGVTGQSSPEREIEETCEKLRSVAPYLRFSTD
ncbi:chorismate-binding protein [Streptomyces rochei]|uniref:chorismate-binding protein n=1 Tax=Streptomyces rochei TaxID=1928 RepID=UPI003A379FF1